VGLVVIASLATAASASASMGDDMLQMVNHKREARGLHPLRASRHLTRKARVHTRKMIRLNSLFHSRAPATSPLRRSRWGENIGCAQSLRRLFRALMRSPVHRANILQRGFHRVGVGALQARGRNICGRKSIWMTQIFYS
jgi:uncharacterized protein YkwD